jgi:hypothetical protein
VGHKQAASILPPALAILGPRMVLVACPALPPCRPPRVEPRAWNAGAHEGFLNPPPLPQERGEGFVCLPAVRQDETPVMSISNAARCLRGARYCRWVAMVSRCGWCQPPNPHTHTHTHADPRAVIVCPRSTIPSGSLVPITTAPLVYLADHHPGWWPRTHRKVSSVEGLRQQPTPRATATAGMKAR